MRRGPGVLSSGSHVSLLGSYARNRKKRSTGGSLCRVPKRTRRTGLHPRRDRETGSLCASRPPRPMYMPRRVPREADGTVAVAITVNSSRSVRAARSGTPRRARFGVSKPATSSTTAVRGHTVVPSRWAASPTTSSTCSTRSWGEPSERERRFPWALGDASEKTNRRVELPFDAVWESRRLIVEVDEDQHRRSIAFWDKPSVKTVSGVSRGEQRAIYDQRKRAAARRAGFTVVEIPWDRRPVPERRDVVADRTTLIALLRAAGVDV